MNGFLCLHKPSGAFVTETERARFVMRSPSGAAAPLRWIDEPGFSAAVTSDGVGLSPGVSRRGSLLGVGLVRLDNREEIASWAGVRTSSDRETDLDLVVVAIAALGADCIAELAGDFAFVIWDAATRTLVAARDPFGVRTLYHATRPGLVALSSRAAALADGERYDLDYLASFLVASGSASEATVFAGVCRVPAGGTLTCRDGSVEVAQLWSPERFEVDHRLVGDAQVEAFRDLFTEAVRLRLTGGADTWAQLSGGLDSSSIVSVAETLAARGEVPCGVGGTVTLVDTISGPREVEYSDAVAVQYGVRNEQIVDDWAWRNDGERPPLTDGPVPLYPFYAQSRRMSRMVRAAGGRVLLSGHGSDYYLTGNLYFFADWIARGRLADASREMLRWAVLGRVSFWRFAFENAVVPLLPARVREGVRPDRVALPGWIRPEFAKRFALAERTSSARTFDERAGRKYAGAIAYSVRALGIGAERDVIDDDVEFRFPFLHRPLIEFALRLPPEMRTRPHARKWVLREAMRGVLPEVVRTRSGKGDIDARIAWSLARERGRMEELLRDPMLGELGCVDVRRLRAAVEAPRAPEDAELTLLLCALSLETWLRVRSGRWTVREREQHVV